MWKDVKQNSLNRKYVLFLREISNGTVLISYKHCDLQKDQKAYFLRWYPPQKSMQIFSSLRIQMPVQLSLEPHNIRFLPSINLNFPPPSEIENTASSLKAVLDDVLAFQLQRFLSFDHEGIITRQPILHKYHNYTVRQNSEKLSFQKFNLKMAQTATADSTA